jgi:hypothetical protein
MKFECCVFIVCLLDAFMFLIYVFRCMLNYGPAPPGFFYAYGAFLNSFLAVQFVFRNEETQYGC